MVPNKNTQGFTLIELVVVIVILGILAATVAPKFIDLQADARTSTLEGVKAAMEGASALVYSKSLIKGNQKVAGTNTPKPTITLNDGTSLEINYGYPRSLPADWANILDLSSNDFLITSTADSVLIIFPTFLGFVFSDTADCIVTYQQATLNTKPIITVNPCV